MDHYKNSFIFRLNNPPYLNYHMLQIPTKTILDNIGTISVLDIDSLHPKTIYSHSSEFIEMHEVFENWLVLWVRKDGLRELHIVSLVENMHFTKRISFRISNDISTESYAVFPGTIDDMESRLYRSYTSQCLIFSNSSYSKGVGIYAYKYDTRETIALKEQRHYQEYFERRVWVKSASSGVRIPITVISLKSIAHKPLPTIINAYGSYSTFKDPIFNPEIFPMLNRGVAIALCHPR